MEILLNKNEVKKLSPAIKHRCNIIETRGKYLLIPVACEIVLKLK